MIKKQRGFSIVSALFILVVLALISSYIVSISSLTRAGGNLTTQGVKAYYAAKSGLEWATYKVAPSGGSGPFNCPTSPSVFTVVMGSSNYTVTVTCVQAAYTENGPPSYNVFQLTSKAEYGTIGTLDYASRIVYITVVQPGT